jgi:uncharacterized protein (DUF433 family)
MSETAPPNDHPDPSNPRIVKSEDVLGGKARIEGRRISVFYIHERVEGRGLDPQTVADRHDLDVADVHRALAYYHEHPDEMRKLRQRRKERHEELDDIALTPEDVE